MSFKIIAITLPHFFPEEANLIVQLLESGKVNRVHLRKPGCGVSKMRELIESIPAEWHPQLSLHDCHELAGEYGCGVHLNGRNPVAPDGFNGIISCSCHSVDELNNGYDYCFLSPVYASISKPGYEPQFSLEQLKSSVNERTVALGGVTPDKFAELQELGFGGAAMLGYIWKNVTVYNT